MYTEPPGLVIFIFFKKTVYFWINILAYFSTEQNIQIPIFCQRHPFGKYRNLKSQINSITQYSNPKPCKIVNRWSSFGYYSVPTGRGVLFMALSSSQPLGGCLLSISPYGTKNGAWHIRPVRGRIIIDNWQFIARDMACKTYPHPRPVRGQNVNRRAFQCLHPWITPQINTPEG